MVEQENAQEQVERKVPYATFRDDKPAEEGYTADLMHVDIPKDTYDNLDSLEILQQDTKNILKVFLNAVEKYADRPYLGTRMKNEDGTYGDYEWMTYRDSHVAYQEIARGAKALQLFEKVAGVNEDGKEWSFCGIWSKNRWEWHTTSFAAMAWKATTIGFYDSMGPQAVDFCVKQTKMESMFCTHEYLSKILDMRESGLCLAIKNVVLFDTSGDYAELKAQAETKNLRVFTLDEVREAGRQNGDIQLREDLVTQDDVYMLNYTSGTTGDPKGVKVKHWSILSSAFIFMETAKITCEDVAVDYLPAPHVFDQFIFLAMTIAGGSNGYYQGNPLKLTEDCQVLKPTIFPSVPRLFNKIYAKLKPAYNPEQPGMFKAVLGGRVRQMITASAPISGDVLDLLKIAFNCPVLEAYGLSETCGAVTLTKEEDPITGIIGGPLKHCAIRLKDLPEMDYRISDKPYPRGEICVRSPCIMPGYFMRPDLTEAAIDSQGYLHTGDVGVVYPNGTIKILDRSKNIFKLSQGEYVAPEKVENVFIQSNFVAQCLVYGDSMKDCCVAIIVPDPDHLAKWASENEKDPKQVVASQDQAFKDAVMADLLKLANERKLNGLEKPKGIHIAAEAFSVENDILTPTFKLKRNVGKIVYQEQINALYEEIAAKAQ